ncbi:glycoside hydrolase family 13 protein [Aspergillus aculeatinus CBS 121060]|uniref:Alpha-glucosidase n=1 Tax=Aspergillus aculeatinus CBS 121060 TaxID=1448322 RepID=A0ACD1H3G8_9EURO|nr:alpha-glucosidase [Aspergillus aculeatinus CBS 121060]RAH68039.1 alpha-glucosidase [Aspergillus aculeatinus CBS 121060]
MTSSNYATPKWWKEAVVYQVYPASFKSRKPPSQADGWGDVRGITDKVPYLKSLGVDVVWTSPIYRSPQVDMGYDISDYEEIDPRYGNMADVDLLIEALHKHNMKLMMDLVVTHTSDQHDWFIESARSKISPKRDWYIWKPPRGYDSVGNPLPPNNWAQILNDSHIDLNWENPDVIAAVHDVMHFWLSRGVSGFRMDVINLISKDPSFPDAPVVDPSCQFQPGERFYTNGPRFHEFMHGIYENVLSEYDTITVGETAYVSDISEIIKTVGATAKELNMIFIFDHMEIADVKTKGDSKWSLRDWKLTELKQIFSAWQRNMIEWDGWNALFLECHDQARSVSRYVDDSNKFRARGGKLLALLQSTLGGTLYLYQGQEIGMRNFSADWDPDVDYKDIESINFWQKAKRLYSDDPVQMQKARELLQKKARDHARTPMQWSDEPNAGFAAANVTPWMRVNDDFVTVNVKAQMECESQDLSVWQYWQLALRHRKTYKDVFVYGDYQDVDLDNEQIYAYLRTGAQTKEKWLVVMNWTGENVAWKIPGSLEVDWMASSSLQRSIAVGNGATIRLQAWEGVMMCCK